MEGHRRFLSNRCRVCKLSLEGSHTRRKRKTKTSKNLFLKEFIDFWDVNVEEESNDIFPLFLCESCKRFMYKVRHGTSSSKELGQWSCHSENDCICARSGVKKRKLKEDSHISSGSETDSADETREELQKSSNVFSTVVNSLGFLTEEEAKVIAKLLAERCDYIFLSRSDIMNSIRDLSRDDARNITEAIFSEERKEIREDVGRCSQTYKDLDRLVKLEASTWTENRNEIIKSAIKGLTSGAKGSKLLDAKKGVACDQLYSLAYPGFISPLAFSCNLLMYSVARSKLSSNIFGKLYPGGTFGTVKSWLDQLTLKIPEFPTGDVLTSIDNDQVLIKKWTVRKENRAQISILTSVCCAVTNSDGTLQQDQTLAPGQWNDRCVSANSDQDEMEKLVNDCSFTPEQKKLLRNENTKLIQEVLEQVAREHTEQDGVVMDDIDAKVNEIRAKEGMRICPVCETRMDKKKRKCINPDCGVNLKSAEKKLDGSEILGTALVAPARQYSHNVRECHLGFTVDKISNKAVLYVKEEFMKSFDEWSHVQSSHPNNPVTVTASDPVFVNPNSFESVKVVLRRVGSAARVKRYHPEDPNAREWLSVTMDGLPYLICKEVVKNVHICSSCGKEVLLTDCQMHTIKEHIGQRVNYIKEFDWALIRIVKLHMEMNMARTFIAVNWDVYFSSLAHELGFVSEAAQKFVKKGSDHHKTMSIIKVAHIGLWYELLVPYVKEGLQSRSEISVNHFLYQWLPCNGWLDPTYRYVFSTTWKFLMALQMFRIGVRRNNSSYVCAGQMAFSPLFHRNNVSKYALIDLYDSLDRASFPPKLLEYVKNTESVSTSGNKSKGEDMDACLEEVNKQSKAWQHGSMVAMDWLRIFRNLGNLNKIREWLLHLIGLRDPKEDSIVSRKRYDFQEEVTAWRVKLRRERYLTQYADREPLHSIDGEELDPKLLDYEQTLEANRRNLLLEKMVKGKERCDVHITPIYVTKDERARAEDLNNLTKSAILIRIADKIDFICSEVLKDNFKEKLKNFKRTKESTKKEFLVHFCEEVEDALNHQLALESACHVEELSDTEE